MSMAPTRVVLLLFGYSVHSQSSYSADAKLGSTANKSDYGRVELIKSDRLLGIEASLTGILTVARLALRKIEMRYSMASLIG